ncbi:MAG: DNA methyltransferase [Armatimonadetes bacterium]|nr:DNA methyltransferase [Armatimonadota bacterium]
MASSKTFTSSAPVASPSRNRLASEDRAFHDWYRFVLSFPPHLVKHYLATFDVAHKHLVLDPFCGTGTTLVEAMKLGFDVVGIEANAMAHLASRVKTNWSTDAEQLSKRTSRICADVSEGLVDEGFLDADEILHVREKNLFGLRDLPEEQAGLLLKNSISPLPLHKSLALIQQILKNTDDVSHAQQVALAKGLVGPIGNLHFGPEVGVLRKKRLDAPVVDIWRANVDAMVSDLRAVGSAVIPGSHVILGDSRGVIPQLGEQSVSAVFTSPPYPNEKDYTRTTRLESVLLGLIKSKQDLRDMKQGMLRSNTRNIYVSDTDHEVGLQYDRIRELCDKIESRRKALGKTSGFERLYWKVTASYFGGMHRHLESLKPALADGAMLGYVVGDQASYFRIHIRTGELIAEIAENLGYELVSIDLFRTRMATATRAQLREEVVVLRHKVK